MNGKRSRGRPWSRLGLALTTALTVFAVAPATGYAETGSAVSWGENFHTELGAGFKSGKFEPRPQSVIGLSTIVKVAAGDSFDLALLSNGTVEAWGGNLYAELGDGTTEDSWEKRKSHVPVSGLSEVTAISASGAHALALLANGTPMGWGTNQTGELGNGEGGVKTNKKTPQAIPSLSHVTAITTGGGSDYALLENGELMAWGENTKGQLGIGPVASPTVCETEIGPENCVLKATAVVLPEVVKKGEAHIAAISGGREFAMFLLSNGSVYAMGSNGKGQLGTGASNTNFNEPQRVANIGAGETFGEAVAISAGDQHALAILSSGKVVGWGLNLHGQLSGTSTEECQGSPCDKTPKEISVLEGATAISAGKNYSLVLKSGKVYAFGLNNYGQLGTGNPAEESNVPSVVEGIGAVQAISAGNLDAIALLKHEVSGPASIYSATAESKAAHISWRYPATEYRLCSTLFAFETDTPACEAGTTVVFGGPKEEGSYTYTGLLSEVPYAFGIKEKTGQVLWISSTPL